MEREYDDNGRLVGPPEARQVRLNQLTNRKAKAFKIIMQKAEARGHSVVMVRDLLHLMLEHQDVYDNVTRYISTVQTIDKELA